MVCVCVCVCLCLCVVVVLQVLRDLALVASAAALRDAGDTAGQCGEAGVRSVPLQAVAVLRRCYRALLKAGSQAREHRQGLDISVIAEALTVVKLLLPHEVPCVPACLPSAAS